MEIIEYDERYKYEIIDLILHIQNDEAKIDLSLQEQPDLMDINSYYCLGGGEFWIAVNEGSVIGTIGLIKRENDYGILKKFFVNADYRNQKVGLKLYNTLLEYSEKIGIKYLLLDTPSVAEASHRFYEKAGFKRVNSEYIGIKYVYPDRNSYLYLKEI